MRQMIFVTKMHLLAWPRGPFFHLMLQQACQRFLYFFQLFRVAHGHTLVPTVDMDLVWHTLQCTPQKYYTFSLALTGDCFVDHDDTIWQGRIQGGFNTTAQLFQEHFGQPYFQCFCWYCNAVRGVTAAKKELTYENGKDDNETVKELELEVKKIMRMYKSEQTGCNGQLQRLAVVSQN